MSNFQTEDEYRDNLRYINETIYRVEEDELKPCPECGDKISEDNPRIGKQCENCLTSTF